MNWLVIYRDKKGEYRWKFKAKNGKILADSGEGYKRKSTCLKYAREVLNITWQEVPAPC